MFIERLVTGLISPQSRLGELDDALVLDVDHYRALLMREARALSEAGALDRAVVGWAFHCIADGWVDEHLHTVRDSLIELGAVADQAHLERLLLASVLRILGQEGDLSPADAMILDTATQPRNGGGGGDVEPLGLRLLARRYALEVGLLSRAQAGGTVGRTALGDTALRLPRQSLLGFLLGLEMLQSAGSGDRWRTPRHALAHLSRLDAFEVPTTPEGRRQKDPEGMLSWRRVRRLALMGLCTCIAEPQAGGESYHYRLLPYGQEVLRQVLRDPPVEVVRLAETLLNEQTKQALGPLLRQIEAEGVAAGAVPVPVSVPEGMSEVLRQEPAVRLSRHTMPETPRARQEAQAVMRPARQAPQAVPAPMPVRQVSQAVPAPVPIAVPVQQTLPVQQTTQQTVQQMAPQPMQQPMQAVPIPVPETPAQRSVVHHAPPSAPQDLDLTQLLQRAWEEIQARQVSFSLNGPSVRVTGDRRALLQAFRELLRSAADAALQGMAPPAVSVDVLVPEGQDVVIQVQDSGPALSSSDRESVLDPSWGLLGEGPRTGLMRAHRALLAQGAAVSLPLSQGQRDGTLVRVTLNKIRARARAAA